MRKYLSCLVFLIASIFYAQTVVCTDIQSTFSVDTADGSSGTPGSTYSWNVVEATFSGTINDGNTNASSIDWGTSPVGANYTVRVVETSSGCTAEETVVVNLVQTPEVTQVTANGPFCSNENEDAVFTITGTPNATVQYSINGGAAQTINIESDGDVEVVVTTPTTSQTIVVSTVAINGNCETNLTGSTFTATVTINTAPTLSTIQVGS